MWLIMYKWVENVNRSHIWISRNNALPQVINTHTTKEDAKSLHILMTSKCNIPTRNADTTNRGKQKEIQGKHTVGTAAIAPEIAAVLNPE